VTETVEFFCGIGGFATCLPPHQGSVGIDINRSALEIYRQIPNCRGENRTIESLTAADLGRISGNAMLWWMSPPCQPYTIRGRQRDLDDPRTAALVNLIDLIRQLRPPQIGLENVPAFAKSRSWQSLRETLVRCGYDWQTLQLCPTQLGSCNRRPRFYLLASLDKLAPWRPIGVTRFGAARPALETETDRRALQVDPDWLKKYERALHIAGEREFLAGKVNTRCFTSAYGRSPVRSGSYLRDSDGIRFFSPREILWQMDFPYGFPLPAWPNRQLWPLVGNTLSQRPILYLLQHLAVAN
jgi:site-specific DNA-cytosine methylase